MKVEIDFWELIRKKWEGFVWKGFRHNLYHGKRYWLYVMSQKIVYIVVSRLWLRWGRPKRQNDKERQKERILKSMVGQSKKQCFWWFFFRSIFYFDFIFVQYDVRQEWWDLEKTWTLFYMLCFRDDRRF